MRKVWHVVDAVYNRYMVNAHTSGRTEDIYLSNGTHTIKLEDCLIWEDTEFTDAEADEILECLLDKEDGVGEDELEGWYLCSKVSA